jgi:hypothetical protein
MPLDWSQCAAVESVPGKVSGAWVLRGTRMPVSAIFDSRLALFFQIVYSSMIYEDMTC